MFDYDIRYIKKNQYLKNIVDPKMISKLRPSRDAPNITKTLKMAKLVTQKLHEQHNQTTMDYYDKNTSEYLDVNLAEFSSIYQPRVNSLALMESNYFDIEDIKKEVENMKQEAKNTSTSYIKNKMYDASNFLKSEKKRILEETLEKHIVEQKLQKFLDKKIRLPNIATEVVRRCSQPQSYIKFRKDHDFLPIKTKSPESYKSQLFVNIKRRKQRPHRVPHLQTPIFPSIFDEFSKPKLSDIKKGQESRKKLRSKRFGSQQNDQMDLPESSQDRTRTLKHSRISSMTHALNLVQIESIDDTTVLEIPTIEGQTISINQYLNDQVLFDNQVNELGKVDVQAQIDISIIDEIIQKEISVKEMSVKRTINLDEVPITIKNIRPKSKNNYKYQKQFLGEEEQGELLIKLIEKYDIANQKDKSKINLPSIKSSRFPSSNRSSTTSLISENGSQIGLAMKQKVLIGVLKLMSIEMNLNQRTFRDLLLSGLKYLLEKEISGQQQFQSQQQTISLKSQGESSEWLESLSSKLDCLKYINSEISNLHQMQRDIKVDQKGIQLEIGQVDALFDEYLQFYNLLKDGDMPHQQDAEILFQVRKLEDIWQSKDQYLQIREFKQLSNQTGLLMIQKYEHNKFVKENAKRRHELKQIG